MDADTAPERPAVETGNPAERPAGLGTRNAVAEIHQLLRGKIVAGQLTAETELNQVQLAKSLGVSRGPVREAIRMLQDEGLVEAQTNLRPRVAPIRPQDVDSLYAQRILIEVLGVTVTVPTLSAEAITECARLCEESIRTRDAHDDAHRQVHYEFHRLMVSALPQPLLATADRLFSQTERYRRFHTDHAEPTRETVSLAEHRRLAEACQTRNASDAAVAVAEHYTRTALHVLALLAPDYEPRAVRAALTLAKRQPG